MVQRKIDRELLSAELRFTTSRSGGPGGQNVNKVNSRVTLHFDIPRSQILTDEEKDILSVKLASQVTRDGILLVTAQESRSQMDNKETALDKFDKLLRSAFRKNKVRKATKPTKSARQERLKAKKVISEKKQWRRKLE